jgi:hypothetical protein
MMKAVPAGVHATIAGTRANAIMARLDYVLAGVLAMFLIVGLLLVVFR